MGSMRRLAAVGCALFLSAYAGMGVVTAAKAQGIKRVGIISAIGDQFEIRKIGVMVFGNELASVPIQWGIDDLVTAKARALLSRRFEVRPVSYQRSAFASLSDSEHALSDALRASASAQGVDAYVVITRSLNKFGTTNQYVAGLGIVSGGPLNSDIFAHATYTVTVMDAREFARISYAAASLPGTSFLSSWGLGGCYLHGPCRKLEASAFPTSHDPAQVAKLKSIIVDLIEQSLPEALRKVQLVD